MAQPSSLSGYQPPPGTSSHQVPSSLVVEEKPPTPEFPAISKELDETLLDKTTPLEDPESCHPVTTHGRLQFLRPLLEETGAWMAGGLCIMLSGIIIVYIFLLPRIYICPGGATCRESFNPQSNVLQLLITLMQYWLEIGTIVTGCGFVKLVAFQSWLAMKRKGNTLETIDIHISAITGSASDALRIMKILSWPPSNLLHTTKENWSLGLFTLSQIGITAAISLFVGFSVSTVRQTGSVHIEFGYQKNFILPVLDTLFNNDGMRAAFVEIDRRLLQAENSSRLPTETFQGTFVVQDNRTLYAIDARPKGLRIEGDVSCTGEVPDLSVVITPDPYPIWSPDEQDYNMSTPIVPHASTVPLMAFSSVRLSVAPASPRLPIPQGSNQVSRTYLWVSNTTGLIPNATTTSDGKMFIALCNHTIRLSEIPRDNGEQVQYIEPSLPILPSRVANWSTPLCDTGNNNLCTIGLVDQFIRYWWFASGARLSAFQQANCAHGVLSPLDDNGEVCRVDSETWTSTLSAMLDTVVQTAEKSGNQSQYLWARAESISKPRWWLQLVIPVSMFLLYGVCLGYTLYFNHGGDTFKELDLLEVISASHEDGVYDVLQEKGVTKSSMVGGMQ
ncbi:hypothetical protein JOM56_013220 [Amanita muscaria]